MARDVSGPERHDHLTAGDQTPDAVLGSARQRVPGKGLDGLAHGRKGVVVVVGASGCLLAAQNGAQDCGGDECQRDDLASAGGECVHDLFLSWILLGWVGLACGSVAHEVLSVSLTRGDRRDLVPVVGVPVGASDGAGVRGLPGDVHATDERGCR